MGWTQPFPPDAKRRHFETLYKLYKIDHFGAVKIGLGPRARSLSLKFPWLSILHHLKHACPTLHLLGDCFSSSLLSQVSSFSTLF